MQLSNRKLENQFQNICLWLVVALFLFKNCWAQIYYIIKSFMSTPQTHTHDTTLMQILKPYLYSGITVWSQG